MIPVRILQVHWLIKRCDKDCSGTMELPEFIELVKHWQMYHAEFGKFSKNKTPAAAASIQLAK
jgi:hypothetical protein